MPNQPLLEVKNLKKYFPVKKRKLFDEQRHLMAVDDISLEIRAGETLGIVGESGCGKSTLAKTIARLYESTSGQVFFKDKEISLLSQKQLRPLRPKIQYVFQDPYESLNPRHTVASILEEPFIIHTDLSSNERKAEVKKLLKVVGLAPESDQKYPNEFSGGQRQRIGIARALALNPEILICDEPVSALDVSVQSQIINLLMKLQRELNIAILFIAHDLAVVKHISDRIAVMYLGKIVESATSDELFKTPRHPYTQLLLDAIPNPNPAVKRSKRQIQGELPSPINPPPGCRFETRCPMATEQCKQSLPDLEDISLQHAVACHHQEISTNNWSSPWE